MNDLFAPAKVGRLDLAGTHAFGRLIGRSQAMKDVIASLRAIAARDATLLIDGQSGTGKELAAEAVHLAGARRDKPFVVVDCAAISRSLIEAELFGHERGAYTGATHARPGAMMHAEGGTLFLDEIGELDLALQPRLLRLIERREVRPLGGTTTRRLDVRIIAATNRDLAREAARGAFRSDLFYRLAVTRVRMPSLAERREDIPLLCRLMAEELPERNLGAALDGAQLERLAGRPWPGNVRELKNELERLATMGADPFTPADLSTSFLTAEGRASFHDGKARAVASFELQYLSEVMQEHAGNITAAAHAAHVDRVHFLRLLDKHGMRPRPAR
jgi:DNA-binding NtrC family response regulator